MTKLVSGRLIKTDEGSLEVRLVGGPIPYVWIGDSYGNYLDSFELEGSPLAVRRNRRGYDG